MLTWMRRCASADCVAKAFLMSQDSAIVLLMLFSVLLRDWSRLLGYVTTFS